MLKFKYMLLDQKPTGNDKYPNDLKILAPVSEATQRLYAHFLRLLLISQFPMTSGRERYIGVYSEGIRMLLVE